MNRPENLERDLTTWFVDTATPRVPDFTDDILRLTAGTRQRPRWSFPERWLPMSVITLGRQTLKPLPWRMIGLLAVLAILIAASIAFYIGSQRKPPDPFGLAGNGRIAYSVVNDIVLVDPATGALTTLVGGPTSDSFPVFSRDGTRLAFERAVGVGNQLFVVDPAGGEPTALTPVTDDPMFGLSWSPDGTEILYSTGDLVLVPTNAGGEMRRLVYDIRSQGFPTFRPPDGHDISFNGSRSDDSASGWYLVKRDGSAEPRPIVVADGSILQGTPLHWIPDGRRFITMQTESVATGVELGRIHVMTLGDDDRVTDDLVVGPQVLLGPIGSPLSPDGTKVIATAAQRDGVAWQATIVPTDGVGESVVTGPVFEGGGYVFTWSPDGQLIVVNDTSTREVWLLDANGGPERRGGWTDPTDEIPTFQRVSR